jgi:excisionase family DNA binding protein
VSVEQAIADVVARVVRQELEAVMSPPATPRLALDVTEVAEALGMSESWVYDAIRLHGLPAKRVGGNGKTLIPVAALQAWLVDEPPP